MTSSSSYKTLLIRKMVLKHCVAITILIVNFSTLIYAGKGQNYVRSKTVDVTTQSGVLRGTVNATWTGRKFFSFRGIQYAESPVGNLRFKPPVPAKPWSGVRDATKDGKICPQYNGHLVGESDEDCLFLNVYTSSLTGNKPVIVYFHPGAFFVMTGASNWNGPDYLMDQDVVLVTLNYRLDALGFLTTEDGVVTGNNGLKDQVTALRWVKAHISSFGGNPNSVTIAGYSAGSTSTIFHMVSPMSKGLFHRVIAMSAGITDHWVIVKEPLKHARKLGGLFNCSDASTSDLVKCLSKVPAGEINTKFEEMRTFGGAPMVVFGPVIEPDRGNGEERFLIDHPVNLIKKGQFQHVPVVTGITELEFASWLLWSIKNQTRMERLNREFDSIAPALFGYNEKSVGEQHSITKKLWDFYLGNSTIIDESNAMAFGRWFSDATIIYGEYNTARLLAKYNAKPVYFYKLKYFGRYGHQMNETTNLPIGPVHHDDLVYLFYISTFLPKLNKNDPEAFMVEAETTFWANFAMSENPTPTNSLITWEPMRMGSLKYFSFDQKFEMINGMPFMDRMQLWESIFPFQV